MGAYCSGRVSFSIKVIKSHGLAVGVISPEFKSKGINLVTEGNFRGWVDGADNIGTTTGGKLSQDLKNGGIISLLLDCTHHTLTATHSRSGKSSTIEVPLGYLCFRVELPGDCEVCII